MLPVIENNISLGNILTIVAVLSSSLGFIWAMKGDIRVVKNDVRYLQKSQEALAEAFSQLGKILTAVAVQDTRISMIEKKVDELSHGRGYVDSRANA